MTARDKIRFSYELAFYPPRLNEVWQRIKQHRPGNPENIAELLDTALLLHQALPETGYASQRALERLALYQARARAFGMVRFLRAVRRRIGLPELEVGTVPGALVRDIALPPLRHTGTRNPIN